MLFGTGCHSLHINHNGGVYVSDFNARIFVALRVKNEFDFDTMENKQKKENTFYPRFIVTDASNQIIVSDFNNDCLHIITQTGHLVTYFDNCELHKPCGLNVDNKRRLWVGLYESRKVKVIKYCK